MGIGDNTNTVHADPLSLYNATFRSNGMNFVIWDHVINEQFYKEIIGK